MGGRRVRSLVVAPEPRVVEDARRSVETAWSAIPRGRPGAANRRERSPQRLADAERRTCLLKDDSCPLALLISIWLILVEPQQSLVFLRPEEISYARIIVVRLNVEHIMFECSFLPNDSFLA